MLLNKLVRVLTCSLATKIKFAILNTKIGFHPQKEFYSEQKYNYIFKMLRICGFLLNKAVDGMIQLGKIILSFSR